MAVDCSPARAQLGFAALVLSQTPAVAVVAVESVVAFVAVVVGGGVKLQRHGRHVKAVTVDLLMQGLDQRRQAVSRA